MSSVSAWEEECQVSTGTLTNVTRQYSAYFLDLRNPGEADNFVRSGMASIMCSLPPMIPQFFTCGTQVNDLLSCFCCWVTNSLWLMLSMANILPVLYTGTVP